MAGLLDDDDRHIDDDKETAMFAHPDLMLHLAHDRTREMIAEADRERLLSGARLARRGRKARGRPTGAVASREPTAVAPAH
ncbi:hypothetical protein [Actinoplanes xinjiangensis]|uniref:hypothetical protein n=1 Tax=Actinoplanes xinjiangensis TaxID=512350 RepID=UPI0034281ED0